MLRVRVAAALALALWALGAGPGCTRTVDATRAIGLPCSGASECSNLCLPRTTYPGGFCSRVCQLDDDCPVGALCATAPTGACLFACFDDDDCSLLVAGWSCRDLGGKLMCAPDTLTLADAGVLPDAP